MTLLGFASESSSSADSLSLHVNPPHLSDLRGDRVGTSFDLVFRVHSVLIHPHSSDRDMEKWGIGRHMTLLGFAGESSSSADSLSRYMNQCFV